MITAKQAFINANSLRVKALEFIEKNIEPQIVFESKLGKFECSIFLDAEEIHNSVVLSDVHSEVRRVLDENGYKCTVYSYGEPFVPRGLQTDFEGNGPLFRNYGFQISWKDAK